MYKRQPLDYAGEFFKLMLMTPFFDPGPIDYAPPPIYIAAVNEQMLRLAGSHCDGVHIHALHTARYLREVALPEIETGLARSSRTRADFTVNTADVYKRQRYGRTMMRGAGSGVSGEWARKLSLIHI